MQGQTVRIVSQAIRYIKEHLHEKMDLDMVALALHYSKYHLHRHSRMGMRRPICRRAKGGGVILWLSA